MERLRLYAVFHLNLAYSSIEESQRGEVIRRCYWPLLQLAAARGLPFGIELSGYTLEQAARLDPAWVKALRRLVTGGGCELIGSGYAQLIGPLVPAEVNAANLRLGHEVYERLLGLRPRVALVNEQAYSAGLVRHYLEAGYEGIIMEWDNPARHHPDWDPLWRYLPQRALGSGGKSIGLIWNKSIAFQKFQRYAHGELELPDYLAYILGHRGPGPRAFPLYGNDVEVFDFRPGRFMTEAPQHQDGEWRRLDRLFAALAKEPGVELTPPSRVLGLLEAPGAGRPLRLESLEQPIPVKKQGKYNVVRWAVTGRDDLGINTACRRLYHALTLKDGARDVDWRELCYLWSSDFRTHITEARWRKYRGRLAAFGRRLRARPPRTSPAAKGAKRPRRDGRYLELEAGRLRIRLDCGKGLAIQGVWLDRDPQPLVGTLPHGFFDDISLGADWYTGHIVLEAPGEPKVTDLCPVSPVVSRLRGGGWRVSARVPSPFGPISKTLEIAGDEPCLALVYRFDWPHLPMGSLRLGHITLHPAAFERSSLSLAVRNGGVEAERFPLAGRSVSHGSPVSFLVSANCALGMTDGRAELGDGRRRVIVEFDPCAASLIGLLTYRETKDAYFCRLALSAGEIDETRRPGRGTGRFDCRLGLRFG